jgi:hypothetical protein
MKKPVFLLAITLALTTLLAGCGDDNDSSAPATTNGTFADAPVDGLAYECGGPTAVTANGGAFSCPTGNTVTFSVGGIIVCSQTVQALITPLSCVQETDPTANTSTPAVVAVAQFLQSIDTTPGTGTLTITPAEQDAAAELTLDFETATQNDLQAAVTAISPGATLVDAATAEAELTNTVLAAITGDYSGTWMGTGDSSGISGTWSITIGSDGSVTGTASDGQGGSDDVSGTLVSGTTYSGTAGGAEWTGKLDTSKTPAEFSGSWNDSGSDTSGTFTGTAD